MFFPKLRRRAKWVFLFLALAFAGSFVFFGVGAGGSGIGDYLSDFFNRTPGSDTPSLSDARTAVAERPNDAQARLDLARAAQAEGEVDLAISSYEQYRTMKPDDSDALRTLAALYGSKIAEAQQRAAVAANQAAEASLPNTLAPQDSEFLQDLTRNPLTQPQADAAQARANAANAEVQRLASAQNDVFLKLTELVDDDPLLYLQAANAAETAQDYASAVSAYEAYLDLQPNSPNAEQIQARVKQLREIAGLDAAPGSAGSDGESDGGGSG